MDVYTLEHLTIGLLQGNENFHPNKALALDHFHGATGGDVKKVSDNAFTGIHSFSNETTFTNTNPSL